MAVTAQQVKELREKTGAGMMDCKKALEATNGVLDAAVDWLREKGIAKAAKKADRVAAEGLCSVVANGNVAYVFEVNSETDFVATNDKFKTLIEKLGNLLLVSNATNTEEALKVASPEGTIADSLVSATATIGEKISLRRVTRIEKASNEVFGYYKHQGGRIVTIVIAEGTDETATKDVAMHVAAMNPKFLDKTQMSQEELNHETEIQKALAFEENAKSAKPKPEAIVEKMVAGRVAKYLKEICLVDQAFVKDPNLTVGQYAQSKHLVLKKYVRLEVGEGIEKVESDFVAEVMAQAKLN